MVDDDGSAREVLRRTLAREGWTVAEAADARVAFITRYGEALLPDHDTVLQEDDLVHLLFPTADRERVEETLAAAPEA